MIIPSYLFAFLAAFVVALAGIYLVHNSHQKCQRQKLLRRDLIERIETLPLPSLASALGVSFTRFFYSAPFSRVNESIELCETCASTHFCVSKLSNSQVNLGDLDFCPARYHLEQSN